MKIIFEFVLAGLLSGCAQLNTHRFVENVGTTYVVTEPTGRYFTKQDGKFVVEIEKYKAKDRIRFGVEDIAPLNLERISPINIVYVEKDKLPQKIRDILPVDESETMSVELPNNIESNQYYLRYYTFTPYNKLLAKEYSASHYWVAPLFGPVFLFDIVATVPLAITGIAPLR